MKGLKWILLCFIVALAGCQDRSSSLINDFKAIDQAIIRSNAMLDVENDKVIKRIKAGHSWEPQKIEQLMTVVYKMRIHSANLEVYMDSMISSTENDGISLRAIKRLDKKLVSYRNFVEDLMKDYPYHGDIPVDTAINYTGLFKAPKTVAIIALHNLKNDIKSTQALCLYRLYKETDECFLGMAPEPFGPVVSTKSNRILIGDKYEATIGLGYSVTDITPEVSIDGLKIEADDYNKFRYMVTAADTGTFVVPVQIRLPNVRQRDGSFIEFKKEIRYTVGRGI